MTQRASRIAWATIIASFTTLLTLLMAHNSLAQSDSFTFFIPYPADQLDDQFDVATNDEDPSSAVADLINDDIVTTISISILRPGSVIYYDHWEDGLEANITIPKKDTTQIWGDNDPSNGIPPNFSQDILNTDKPIILQEIVEVPRNPAQIFFDGGDKLSAVGGNIAVSLAVWPETANTLFAGAWELYPTSRWGTEYIVPVGEDIAGQRPGFGRAGISIQARLPNTSVEIDLDGDGTPEISDIIKERGGHFTQIEGILSGTQIQTSGPVQVHLFTGDPNQIPNAYEARAYTLVPTTRWTDDYIASRSSDGDYWLYNPDETQPLTVLVTTVNNVTDTITIQPNSTSRYRNNVPLSTATGARFQSTDGRPFYGIVALDQSFRQDWGYTLLPFDNLTTQVLVGWGVSNINPTPGPVPIGTGDESRLYVTAATTTTLSVNYDSDPDVDFTTVITPLAEVDIVDPDFDLTGAFLFSQDQTPFIAVWGQDESANPAEPSIDVGTAIVPIPSLAIQKSLELANDADNSGNVTWGDTVRFVLRAYNNTIVGINNVEIVDDLPNSVEYVPGSTRLNGAPVADDASGATIFPVDENGIFINVIPAFQTVTISFDSIVKPGVSAIQNSAVTTSPDIPTEIDPGDVDVPIEVARYELDKRVIRPANKLAKIGDEVVFGITITNTGNITITKLPLQDTFIEDDLTFTGAQPLLPDSEIPAGVLTWNDLISFFGPLLPTNRVVLTLTFVVDPIPPSLESTQNIALVSGAEADDIPLPPLDDDVRIFFPTPPGKDGKSDDKSDPTPLPKAPPNPPDIRPKTTPDPNAPGPPGSGAPGSGGGDFSPPAGGAQPTGTVLPVALLPETGERSVTPTLWPLIVFIIVGGWIFWVVNRHIRETK